MRRNPRAIPIQSTLRKSSPGNSGIGDPPPRRLFITAILQTHCAQTSDRFGGRIIQQDVGRNVSNPVDDHLGQGSQGEPVRLFPWYETAALRALESKIQTRRGTVKDSEQSDT